MFSFILFLSRGEQTFILIKVTPYTTTNWFQVPLGSTCFLWIRTLDPSGCGNTAYQVKSPALEFVVVYGVTFLKKTCLPTWWKQYCERNAKVHCPQGHQDFCPFPRLLSEDSSGYSLILYEGLIVGGWTDLSSSRNVPIYVHISHQRSREKYGLDMYALACMLCRSRNSHWAPNIGGWCFPF